MSQSDYSRLDRLLHRFALGTGFIARASFEAEDITSKTTEASEIKKPVYIAGLARSGSTILLNVLYQTGKYRSLTYRDMPFILMTGLWQKLSAPSRATRDARERAHGDRIMVAYDSPEAFEEVFWRHFLGKAFISSDSVIPHKVTKSVRGDYRRFVMHVLASAESDTQSRYLAKNNNNLLRLPSLRAAFPDAILLVPFRHPVQQAISLHNQHTHFCALHQTDKFSKKYMEWLGHYEFGLGQKHYLYNQSPPDYALDNINYWLQSWIDAYKFALRDKNSGLIFVGYEQLGAEPLAGFTRLFHILDLDSTPGQAAEHYDIAKEKDVSGLDSDLLAEAENVYGQLCDRHQQSLG